MLQIRTRIDVADNSGARMATMIGVIGKATMTAGIGDVITANVKEATPGGTVKKGDVGPNSPLVGPMAVTCVSTTTPSSSSTRISTRVAPASLAPSPVNCASAIS